MAGNVPTGLLAKPRAVAAPAVALVQAQSMAPFEVAAGIALLTFGANTIVWPFKPVGIPLFAVAAIATETIQFAMAPVAAQLAAVGVVTAAPTQ